MLDILLQRQKQKENIVVSIETGLMEGSEPLMREKSDMNVNKTQF